MSTLVFSSALRAVSSRCCRRIFSSAQCLGVAPSMTSRVRLRWDSRSRMPRIWYAATGALRCPARWYSSERMPSTRTSPSRARATHVSAASQSGRLTSPFLSSSTVRFQSCCSCSSGTESLTRCLLRPHGGPRQGPRPNRMTGGLAVPRPSSCLPAPPTRKDVLPDTTRHARGDYTLGRAITTARECSYVIAAACIPSAERERCTIASESVVGMRIVV